MKATRHLPVLGRPITITLAIGYMVLAPAWAIVANSDTVGGAPTVSVQAADPPPRWAGNSAAIAATANSYGPGKGDTEPVWQPPKLRHTTLHPTR
jgi:hypothetical protein